MVKISDILKRGHDEDQPREKKPAETSPETQKAGKEETASLTPQEQAKQEAPQEAQAKPEPTSPLKIAALMREGTKAAQPPAQEVYQELLTLSQDILASEAERLAGGIQKLCTKIDRVIDQMALAGEGLIELANSSSPENYLIAHLVNVSLLALKIGLGWGYNKSKLNELGVAAFLHDRGMVKVLEIAQRPRRLKQDEYAAIKEHPRYEAEILAQSKGASEVVIAACYEHHERIDHTGYPRGLRRDEIGEYARIIGLVDVYEALTHPRAWRPKFLPYEAVKEMIQFKEQLDTAYLKVLIEEIGIYPVGSWVLLNSEEIGKVIKVNKGLPLQPTIAVIVSPGGRKPEEAKSIDLTKHPTIYIKKPLDETKLAARFTAR